METCNWWDGEWLERSEVARYKNTQETQCLSAVDNLTWVPRGGCRLPELDHLASGHLYALLQRTCKARPLCFMGDSLIRQIYTATQCLLGVNPLADRANADPALHQIGHRALFFDSKYLSANGLNRETGIHTVSIDSLRPTLLTDPKLSSKCGALVLGSGHHFDHKTTFYDERGTCGNDTRPGCGGKYDAYHSMIKNVRQSLERHHFSGPVVWASFAPRHFRRGDWNSGGSCNYPTRSGYAGAELADDMPDMYSQMQKYDELAVKAWQGTRLRFGVLNISELSWTRPDAHIGLSTPHSNSSSQRSVIDCTHYVNVAGGVPATWVRGLAMVLVSMGV